MSAYTIEVIVDQEEMIREITSIGALVDACRGNQDLQDCIELDSVCKVLMMATDRLFQLEQSQLEKLKIMNQGNEGLVGVGGFQR